MSALETALNEAHAKTYHLDLHPLVGQLHAAAGRLRQSANGSAARVNPIAQRLDDAAGDLLQVLRPSINSTASCLCFTDYP